MIAHFPAGSLPYLGGMMLTRPIHSSGETLPVIGLGTWQKFDVDPSTSPPALTAVLESFRTGGGRLIDSSPMYGRAEAAVGTLTSATAHSDDFFYATKVWTTGREEGIRQMEDSFRKLQRKTIDLMQIHNLVDWKNHLKTLRAWKEAGRIRYIGITHYTDDSHPELERIMAAEPLDFVQFNYSIFNRHAESRLLPAAAAQGVATLINRSLGYGDAVARVRDQPLPDWAAELGIYSWGQFLLKYLVSHPDVTSVIPATGNPAHMADNIAAGEGPVPDAAMRTKMAAYVAGL